MCKVSIIVPVYNVEKYIEECINSILSQSFADFELILIDDGSRDNSAEICMKYQKIDSRIKFIKKNNGGVSSARNVGLECAEGEFITFVDADDCIEANHLSRLMQYASFDLVVGGYKEYFNTKSGFVINNENSFCLSAQTIAGIDALTIPRGINIVFYFPWAKLFRHQIISDGKLRFNENMTLAEDTCFIMEYLKYASNLIIIPSNTYIYRIFYNSSKHSLSADDFISNYKEFVFCIESLKNKYHYNFKLIKSNIETALFFSFLQRLYSLSFDLFSLEMKKIDVSIRFNILKSLVLYYGAFSIARLLYYSLVICSPILGYILIKLNNIRKNG